MIASEADLISNQTPGQSLPHASPCLSFWQRTTRAFPLLHVNRHNPVPETSEYVIIGSGLSGALTAFSLLEEGVTGNCITILEAREAASGASSRNAGHVRPDAFRGFKAYSMVHGPEQARKIIENEKLVLRLVDEFAKRHNVPCDFHHTTTFDVCMTPEFAAYEAESLEAFRIAGGDVSHVNFYDGKEARSVTKIEDAIAAYEWPAGSVHPAKLTHWLLKTVVGQGVKLYTHCPATQISRQKTIDKWLISTPQGAIMASKVIHCTNAFASFLLPQLAQHVTPNRAQAHTLIPSFKFSGGNVLTKTYSLRYSLRHFYSLIQRQDDGVIVWGVSRTNPTLSAETLASTVSTDDSYYNEEISRDALSSFDKIFQPEGNSRSIHGEGFDSASAWTGIIGMTTDSVPFVGEIEEGEGQFICAGFNGHGMARIFACAPGVAKLVVGGKWDDTGLPECFAYDKRRLRDDRGKKTGSVW